MTAERLTVTVEVEGIDGPTTPEDHAAVWEYLHAMTLVATADSIVAGLPGAGPGTVVTVSAGLDVLAHRASSSPLVHQPPHVAAQAAGHPSRLDTDTGRTQAHLVAVEPLDGEALDYPEQAS